LAFIHELPVSFSRFYATHSVFYNKLPTRRMAVRLALISILAGVVVMQMAISIVSGFESAIYEKMGGFVGEIQLTYYNPESQLQKRPLPYRPGLLDTLKQQFPEIQEIAPYIFYECLMIGKTDHEGIRLKGVADFTKGFYQAQLRSGRLPKPAAPGTEASREILVSVPLARVLQIQTGDEVKLLFLDARGSKARKATVVGTYETGLAEFDRNFIFCDIALLQNLLRKSEKGPEADFYPDFPAPNETYDAFSSSPEKQRTKRWEPTDYEGYEIYLKPGSKRSAEEIAFAMASLIPHNWKGYPVRERYSDLFNWIKLQRQNVGFILTLLTLVAIINMSTAILILITEQTPTLGLLRALGASRKQVQHIFLWKALYLITAGVLLGNLVAYTLMAIQYFGGFFRLNPEDYFVETVPIGWPWDEFMITNLGVIAICTLAMWLPSLVAGRVQPVAALKLK
jgi:lipoprotein-releasing system permease protein